METVGTRVPGKRGRSKRKHRKSSAKRSRRINKATAEAETADQVNASKIQAAAREKGIQVFREFYRKQRVLEDDDEFEKFMRVLFQPLPVSFRVCSIGSRQAEVEACISQAQPWLIAESEAGGALFKWAGAWQLACDERRLASSAKRLEAFAEDLNGDEMDAEEIRGTERAKLSRWLIAANQLGLATRQEIVSMLPVALLEVQPAHSVLDLCASPGSKTTQALEALYKFSDDPLGFVVANELVGERAHVLAARCLALGACCKSLIVTCHRAQIFPETPNFPGYDRIVCDVPCSGDGTFRKHRDKWAHWAPCQGQQMHSLQLQIALRAARLLRVGGVMAYSTCSLNPLEDEAVVAALLLRTEGALELVKCNKTLSGFPTQPGLSTWKVLDEDMREWSSRDELKSSGLCPAKLARFRASMWPPEGSAERAQSLRRCMRILPHHHNTGGFFVALLRKTCQWPASPASLDSACRVRRETRSVQRRAPCKLMVEPQPTELLLQCLCALNLQAGSLECGLPWTAGAAAPIGGKGGWLYSAGANARRCFLMSPPLASHMASSSSATRFEHDDSAESPKAGRCFKAVAAGVCVAEREYGSACGGPDMAWRLTRAGAEALRTRALPGACVSVSRKQAAELLAARFRPVVELDAAVERGCVYIQVEGHLGVTLPGRVMRCGGVKLLALTLSGEEARLVSDTLSLS